MLKQKVKIKTRQEMEQEFGFNEFGSINCDLHFTKEMEEDIPKDRIIEVTSDRYGGLDWQGWGISEDMIKEKYD